MFVFNLSFLLSKTYTGFKVSTKISTGTRVVYENIEGFETKKLGSYEVGVLQEEQWEKFKYPFLHKVKQITLTKL